MCEASLWQVTDLGIQMLLDLGAEPDVADVLGNTSLHVCPP